MEGAALLLGLILLGRCAVAQTGLAGSLNPLQAGTNGIHLYSVSLYDGYFSSPQPYPGALPGAASQADDGYGIGASIGFNYLRSGSGISLTYSPSYNRFARNSNLSSLNHALSLNIHNRRDPGRKWHTSFAAVASIATPTQFLFAPTALGQLADAAVSFDDLANGVVAGRFSNDQVASLLTGALLPESPAGLVLYGNYNLSAAVQGMVTYNHSSRFSIGTTFTGLRMQVLPRFNGGANSAYLLPGTWSGTGSLQIGYSLSERTQLQVSLSTTRTMSRLEDTYVSSGEISLNRIMSQRWFVQLRGGTSSITPLYGSMNLDRKPQPVGGGSIGYKTESNTFMLQTSRQLADQYGFGALSTWIASAAWSWRPHGSSWSALANAGWQRMEGTNAVLSESWIGRLSLNRALSDRTGVTLAYAYLSNRGTFAKDLPVTSVDSVIFSFYWLPGGEKQRGTPASP